MARPIYSIDNRSAFDYLSQFHDYEDIPRWVDDVITGALGQKPRTGLRTPNPARYFRLLQALSTINTRTVSTSMNRKRTALGDAGYSQRQVEYVTAILRCASQGIKHGLLTRAIPAQSKVQELAYSNPIGIALSEDQKAVVRSMAITGRGSEINGYIQSLKQPQQGAHAA